MPRGFFYALSLPPILLFIADSAPKNLRLKHLGEL